MTPLHASARAGSIDCCKLLSSELGKDTQAAISKKGDTSLHLAAFAGSVECVSFLIDQVRQDGFALVKNRVMNDLFAQPLAIDPSCAFVCLTSREPSEKTAPTPSHYVSSMFDAANDPSRMATRAFIMRR
jgi:ankyrin repeat protein